MRVHIFISGKVQGVFFRFYLKKRAEKLSLNGWAKNLADGRVEAVFEGGEEEIKKIIKLCQIGSPMSQVEKIEISKEKEKNLDGFKIAKVAKI